MPGPALDQAALLAAEESRRLAMLAGDTLALAELLSDALLYGHSTGRRDSKQGYLEKLAGGSLRYEALAFVSPVATLMGRAGTVSALMKATVLRGGKRHEMASSYLAVWQYTPAGWKLEAVQATSLPAAP